MKISKNQLRQLIREAVDGYGPLGSYVSPDDRTDLSGINEPNTKLEAKLMHSLKLHFMSGDLGMPRMATDLIGQLITNQNYPDIFKRYDAGKLYRGMLLDHATFKKLFKAETPGIGKFYSSPINWFKQRGQLGKKYLSYSPSTKPGYTQSRTKPSGSVTSSWSKSLDHAWRTAKFVAAAAKVTDDTHVIVIMLANASDDSNMFFDLQPIYDKFTFGNPVEEEVVGIGNIRLEEVYTYPL